VDRASNTAFPIPNRCRAALERLMDPI